MLKKSMQIRMSEYKGIYDVVVGKEHFLRKVKEEIDFGFVNELLKGSYCENFGRPAKEPELIFKILFLKKLYDLSDEALIDQIKVNMAYKFFLDMLPEEEPINSSLLTKFRKTRITQDILEDMLKETVRQAIEKGLIKSTAIIVDSTHSLSRFNRQKPTEILRKLTKDLRYQIYNTDYDLSVAFPDKPGLTADISEEIIYTKNLIEAVRAGLEKSENQKAKSIFTTIEALLKDEKVRELQSIEDTEARIGHKATGAFFGYKSHLAMTEERLITGVKITDGCADDGKILPDLIKQSEEGGIAVDEVIGDAAYAGLKSIKVTKEKNIRLVSKMHPSITAAHTKEHEGFTYNKDIDRYICPAGHSSKSCVKCYHNLSSKRRYIHPSIVLRYRFVKNVCAKCPMEHICKIPKRSRMISVTVPSENHIEQLNFQKSDYFKTRYRQRYKIEAKNAEAKRYHGLMRADSRGVFAMNIQSYFTAFALNIKRILKLQAIKTK